jgi:hypothetical protein
MNISMGNIARVIETTNQRCNRVPFATTILIHNLLGTKEKERIVREPLGRNEKRQHMRGGV